MVRAMASLRSLSTAHRPGEGNRASDDARLLHQAIEKLVDLAKHEGVELRQSYGVISMATLRSSQSWAP
jgi:hypothetical protein